jgi:hypothetical protein
MINQRFISLAPADETNDNAHRTAAAKGTNLLTMHSPSIDVWNSCERVEREKILRAGGGGERGRFLFTAIAVASSFGTRIKRPPPDDPVAFAEHFHSASCELSRMLSVHQQIRERREASGGRAAGPDPLVGLASAGQPRISRQSVAEARPTSGVRG